MTESAAIHVPAPLFPAFGLGKPNYGTADALDELLPRANRRPRAPTNTFVL
jgi:hypothetical protein